jgi:hypothetical protein
MISIEKDEILNSIGRVSMVIEDICLKRNKTVDEVISSIYNVPILYSREQISYDYRIYTIMQYLRIISYLEDSYLDLIKESDLDFSKVKEKIFVNKEDAKKFSNKQIIKYIRNAVAHSDGEKQLFKITPNGKYVGVTLKNIQPVPFDIKMSVDEFWEIIDSVCHATSIADKTNVSYVNREENSIKRVYIKSVPDIEKLSNEITREMPEYNYNLVVEYIIKYFKEHNVKYEEREYKLFPQQIELLKKAKDYIENNPSKNALEPIAEECFQAMFNQLIPLAESKIDYLRHHINIITSIYLHPNYTYEEIKNEIMETGRWALDQDGTDKKVFEGTVGRLNMNYYLNNYFLIRQTIYEYITFYISCCCDEETITIDNKQYNKENIRDALVHGRFFYDYHDNIVLCDTKNGKHNDYNFYWTGEISTHKLFMYCIDSIKNKKRNNYR